jgi:hypothetical protein
MNRILGACILVVAVAIAVAAFAIPMTRYDDAEVPADVEAELKESAGQTIDFKAQLFGYVREANWGGPEPLSGEVSYRTIFGVEVHRVSIRGSGRESLLDRGSVAVWLWVAFAGAEIALVSLGVWQLTARRGAEENTQRSDAPPETSLAVGDEATDS